MAKRLGSSEQFLTDWLSLDWVRPEPSYNPDLRLFWLCGFNIPTPG